MLTNPLPYLMKKIRPLVELGEFILEYASIYKSNEIANLVCEVTVNQTRLRDLVAIKNKGQIHHAKNEDEVETLAKVIKSGDYILVETTKKLFVLRDDGTLFDLSDSVEGLKEKIK